MPESLLACARVRVETCAGFIRTMSELRSLLCCSVLCLLGLGLEVQGSVINPHRGVMKHTRGCERTNPKAVNSVRRSGGRRRANQSSKLPRARSTTSRKLVLRLLRALRVFVAEVLFGGSKRLALASSRGSGRLDARFGMPPGKRLVGHFEP